MKRRLCPLLLTLATACGVEHATVDAGDGADGGGLIHDAAGSDGATIDASATDSALTDVNGTDTSRPDTSRPDTSRPDTSGVDAAVDCSDDCMNFYYTACSCSPADPCGWSDDGYCDLLPPDESCAVFPSHFDDSWDCPASTDAGLSDAATPDSARPDAARPDSALPDSAQPDAATSCVGTWSRIPPFTLTDGPERYVGVTSVGETVYLLYTRPTNPEATDLATWTQATGWTTFASTPAVDMSYVYQFEKRDDHLVVWYSPGGGGTPVRAVYDLGTHGWALSDPFSGWNPDYLPGRTGGSPALATDWLVYEGEFFSTRDSQTGQMDTCRTRERTRVFPFDDPPPEEPPATPSDDPLGSRAGPLGVDAGEWVFYWGGTYTPPTQACWYDYSRIKQFDGAFFNPALGIWGPAVAVPDVDPGSLPTWPMSPRGVWTGTEVVIFEDYTGTVRANRLAPGQTEFRSTALNYSFEYALNNGALAGGPFGVVVWGEDSGYHLDLSTMALSEICAAPADIAGVRRFYARGTEDSVVLFGDDMQADLSGAILTLP